MKVVVADTSPINYLVLIDCPELLRELFGKILVPRTVLDELSDAGAPPKVASWIRSLPEWLEVREETLLESIPPELEVSGLDEGEIAAIQLALEAEGSLLLIDEAAGRAAATRLGIASTGTLGVLLAGSKAGLIDLRYALSELQKSNFRVSKGLIESLLAQ